MTRPLFFTAFVLLFPFHSLAQQERASQQPFNLPGVEWSQEQQSKIDALREKFAPRLNEVRKKYQGIYTQQQQRARREAVQAARDAGKQGPELQRAIELAVQLTGDQKKELAALREAQGEILADIQNELRALLTDDQRSQVQRRRRGNADRRPNVPATHRNVQYGPHDRNVMDVWLAESSKPTPVLVSIHGGGFRGGNKSVRPDLLAQCLDSGISVVAITYRLSQDAIAPASFLDSARAIQFIRHKAEEWNLDPRRIAATGGSAGAGISLWLGFHDDLANPDSDDPVLRQSTRLTCMSVYNGQTSYDPRFIRDLFPGSDTYKHSALAQLYDVDLDQLDDLPAEKYKLFEKVSALPHLTKDDPPAQLIYGSAIDAPITSQGVGIHHPRFGKVLKEKMDELGIECQVHAGAGRGSDGTMEFIKKHLGI